jgi:hypothetical protein
MSDKDRLREFVANQKHVHVPPSKDEFRRWKTMKTMKAEKHERNDFADWKEKYPSTSEKPKQDILDDKGFLLRLLSDESSSGHANIKADEDEEED